MNRPTDRQNASGTGLPQDSIADVFKNVWESDRAGQKIVWLTIALSMTSVHLMLARKIAVNNQHNWTSFHRYHQQYPRPYKRQQIPHILIMSQIAMILLSESVDFELKFVGQKHNEISRVRMCCANDILPA